MPLDVEYLRGLDIETFDPARHDRAAFTCGIERIDNFLKITAPRYSKEDSGRIYVAVERNGGRLVGFYALGPHAIDASRLNEDMRKRLPNFERISSFYLSVVAAHSAVQNKGLGGYLLADALKRCMRSADEIGGRFVVLDAISAAAAKLYARFGFVSLAGQPNRMVVGMAKLRASDQQQQL